MKDIIEDRLNKINDLKERRMLKNVLLNVYESVTEYNMEMYDLLEKRIYKEIDEDLDKYFIYLTLEYVENADPISDFMHPMIESDLEGAIYDMNEINENLQKGVEIVLTSIFMKCSSLNIKKMIDKNKTYKCIIKTDKDNYEVNIKLKRCEKYINEVKNLYKIFQYNSKVWNTINCGFIYKYVDIVLHSSLELSEGEKILEITIDLGEYEKYKVARVIPMWNVKQLTVQDNSFPMPAFDRINYEHSVSLEELGIQNGYMTTFMNKNDVMYIKQYEKELVIVSSNSEQAEWNVLQIENIQNNSKKHYEFEILSNKKDNGFIGRYASMKSMIVRTKGEVARILALYEASKSIIFDDIEILDEYKKEEQTLNYNEFIDDNIRVDKYKKIMLIKFKSQDENYLLLDKMSFLVSEIQVLFPEYKCIGEL